MISIEDINAIVFDDREIAVDAETMGRIADCYRFLEDFKRDKVIYGINTGFGPMAQYRVSDEHLSQLQYNIIRSHSAGAGEPLSDECVRAAMLSRLYTFVRCRSGVHPDVVRILTQFINNHITPYVPQHGSVGASGDLVQLAHIALTLIGEGKVRHEGRWQPSLDVMRRLGIEPLTVRGRDGLSLVNGTAVMTGIGIVCVRSARRLLDWCLRASVLMNEVAGSYDDFMAPELNGQRLQTGQQTVAERMRQIAAGSRCLRNRQAELYDGTHSENMFRHKVQPYYSLRCVPQVLGPVLEAIDNAERILVNEVNSADDNPLVDPDTQNVYHGGNFHGDYVSFEMDKLKIAVTKLTMLAERQLNYLLHDRINDILPPFVNLGTLGLNYGMQACQFTATSTTAECQTLSNPMYVHSIPNNNDNQDIVSMGTNSALLALRVVDNSFQVMSVHIMALMQAVDCLKAADRLSDESRTLYRQVRAFFPAFADDTEKHSDMARVEAYLRRGFDPDARLTHTNPEKQNNH